jgi:hypothetical protein
LVIVTEVSVAFCAVTVTGVIGFKSCTADVVITAGWGAADDDGGTVELCPSAGDDDPADVDAAAGEDFVAVPGLPDVQAASSVAIDTATPTSRAVRDSPRRPVFPIPCIEPPYVHQPLPTMA